MQVHHLWRRTNLHWAQVHGVVHLILSFDLALLAVILHLSENRLGRLLSLGLEQVLEIFCCLVDLLIRSLRCWSEVVYITLLTLNTPKFINTAADLGQRRDTDSRYVPHFFRSEA